MIWETRGDEKDIDGNQAESKSNNLFLILIKQFYLVFL